MPRSVWALGITSLFMDMCSEMIHALLPVYLTGVLGLSVASVGWIEGIAEATAMAVKVFSGALSDWLGKRKFLALLGYGLAALAKPVFPLATGAGAVIAARFIDRVGKGIRGAPRDALVADLVEPSMRGAAYGLRQSMDSWGAVIGPLIAVALMLASGDNYRLVFWIAVIPAALAVATLAFGVEDAPPAQAKAAQNPLSLAAVRQFPRAFWIVTALLSLLALARVSEAFLVLRAVDAGLAPAFAPLVLIAMGAVYAAGAFPAGLLADRLSTRMLLALAILSLIASEILLALPGGLIPAFAGIVLWGAHLALSQGLSATLVAASAPAALRGTAFGLFNLAGAAMLLIGNAGFGALWAASGYTAAYAAAALTAACALPLLALVRAEKAA